jgi:glutamyl-tRNA reductase
MALRERFRTTLEAELERSLRGQRVTLEPSQKESLQRALGAAVEKMLHTPTERLREWAKDDHCGDWHTDLLVSAVEELFQLHEQTVVAPMEPERAKP